MNRSRVIVGLSGGVDSSVAALLLQRFGYEVHAVFMKNWEDSYEPGYCAAAEDLEDAQAVCEALGIPLHKVNFSTEYRQRVFDYFLQEHRCGRTPNPDVLCNKEIKFKAFLHYAERLGGDYLATGHYARVHGFRGHRRLLKGRDPTKDQSYFLHALSQEQLAKVLFPIGELHKKDVRALARDADLTTYDKCDSTGICFIGERDFQAFLRRYLPTTPGEIRTPEGETLGTHAGLAFYTVGQRQGLGIGGRRGSKGEPWYVIDKNMSDNTLIVVQGSRHPGLFHRCLQASRPHWIAGRPPPLPCRCQAKIRYRQAEQPCRIDSLDDSSCVVTFDEPQRAITPGQSVVFYSAEECLGGATIVAARPLPMDNTTHPAYHA